ncbi:FHA domain-containing protein [Pendulispora brunnea]|uniref:FHA domain-containing protein n=1 Tax=Pendulispora brunnea TaxID=2905690 RepID=A0ABZ2KJN4_9BACT
MGVFDRIFGKGGYAQVARRAELRGDLARAAELWDLAGQPEETARVMLLRGDAELEPTARRQHYLQAKSIAPEGHSVREEARRKHALLTLAMAKDGALSTALRQELLAAARELEELGEPLKAADGYRLAHDEEGEARALTQAGEIDKLESLLTSEQDRQRRERARQQTAAEVEMLIAGGRRREALATGQAWLETDPDDRLLRERCDALRARRTRGSVLRVVLEGRDLLFAFGQEIVLGRTEPTMSATGPETGHIAVASHAVSRRHLRIVREGGKHGETFAMDLGSRNGTYLRGMRAAGKLSMGAGLELHLGNEVPVRLTPSTQIAGAIVIEVAGRRYIAPFGAAPLPVADWQLDMGPGGWLELVSSGANAFLGDAALASRASLLAGDRIARTRGGPCVLEIAGET